MALDADALVTLADAKLQLKIVDGDNSNDAFIESMINFGSDFAEDKIGRKFSEQTVTDKYFDGRGTESLLLDPWPVITFTSLNVDESRRFQAATLLTEWNPTTGVGHFTLDKETGEISLIDSSFPYGRDVIKASYLAGYTAATVPGPVKMGVLLLIDKWFDESKQSADGRWVLAETIGSYSVRYGTAFDSASSGGSTSDPMLSRLIELWKPYMVPSILAGDRPTYVRTV